MEVYAAKHKDTDIIMASRSGGVFTALSSLFLGGGVVYGCVLNDNFEAVHICATEECDRDRMRGSKYVQSNLGDSFRKIKSQLEENRKVLFSGTSCQVAGLKCYLGREYTNLLCVDIVCHGVPSPKVWKSYINTYSKVIGVEFRNKIDFGWRDHRETIYTENDKITSTTWTKLFYGGYAFRPSCYECPYKSINHPGDITIADYWGIESAAPEYDDNKGVSLVLVNSEKGKEYFELCKAFIDYKETRIEDSMQRSFIKPEERPKGREKFWHDFNNKSFSYIARKYGDNVPKWYRYLRNVKYRFFALCRRGNTGGH